LRSTPNGDLVCVYVEGSDPVEANRRFAESRSPHDTWFKEQCLTFFAPGIDQGFPDCTLAPLQVVETNRGART